MNKVFLLSLFLFLSLFSVGQVIGGIKKKVRDVKSKPVRNEKPDMIEPDDVPPFSEAIRNTDSLHLSTSYSIRTIAGIGDTRKGSGQSGKGFKDGLGRFAEFDNPAGLLPDGKGNILIADAGNYAIRKMDSTFQITTIAGTGKQGFADGPFSTAGFYFPVAIAMMKSGDILIADKNAGTIRQITDSGLFTYAGNADNPYRIKHLDGNRQEARFNSPIAIVVNSKDEIFIADEGNHCIRKIANGIVASFAGMPGESGYQDGRGEQARFSKLKGMVIDRVDNIYVTDGNIIRKISPDGIVTTWAGEYGSYDRKNGTGIKARFNTIGQIAISPAGNIFVTDYQISGPDGGETVICRITPDAVVTTIADGLTESQYKKALYKIYGEGLSKEGLGYPVLDGAVGSAYFQHINGMYVDAAENIWISDAGFHCIRRISAF